MDEEIFWMITGCGDIFSSKEAAIQAAKKSLTFNPDKFRVYVLQAIGKVVRVSDAAYVELEETERVDATVLSFGPVAKTF